MTLDAGLTLAILAGTLLVLASQRVRPDLTAVGVTLALILTGVLSAAEAFGAFGQPVIILVACIYILGAALFETGVATLIADRLQRFSHRGPSFLLLIVMLTAGLLSAVLSSLLVIAVLMPAILRLCRKAEVTPSQLLLPLVVGASMGNLVTLLGTISNLVVSDLLAVGGHGALGLFAVTPVGLASLVLAIVWFVLVGHRLLRREAPSEAQQPSLDEIERAYRLGHHLHRLRVRSVSDLIGRRLEETPLGRTHHLNVVAIQPRGGALKEAMPGRVLDQDDVLIVEGNRGDVLQAASRHSLETKGMMPLEDLSLERDSLPLAELIVPFRSQLVGKTLAQIDFRERYGLNILAAHRQGRPIGHDLPDLTLAPGDTLLVQGSRSNLRRIGRDLNLLLVTQLGPQPGDLITAKTNWALGILGVMLVCVVSGVLSLAAASLAAAVALVVTGCLSLQRAYESIDGKVIVLIGGMLPLAIALQKTGAAELIAGQLAGLSPAIGALGTLMLLYLFTVVLTQVISNTVTATLMTPIAINLAITQGLEPRISAIAIAVAVTSSYLTALASTDALFVRDKGQYRLRDYMVSGLPVLAIQTIALIVYIWLSQHA